MRKFTLTAIAIKDARVVGVFQLLEQTPKLDGEGMSARLSEFLKRPYQTIVYGPYPPIFLDQDIVNGSDFVDGGAEVVAFSVWRAATALRNSKALEADGVKHGNNWLVKLDDEPFEVKFVLEDQAQNYLILNVLPTLESTVVINESGWLHSGVEAHPEVEMPTTDEGSPTAQLQLGDQSSVRMKKAFEFDTNITETFLAEASLRGQRATRVIADDAPHVPSEEDKGSKEEPRISTLRHDHTSEGMRIAFRDGFLGRDRNADVIATTEEKDSEVLEQVNKSRSASKAMLGEQNPVHNHYVNGDEIPTTHTELDSPNLEI